MLYLLAVCHKEFDEVEPLLLRHLKRKQQSTVKASLIFALTDLWQTRGERNYEQYCTYLLKIFEVESEAPLVRFVCGLSLIRLGGASYFNVALPVFRSTISSVQKEFKEVLWRLDYGEAVEAVGRVLSSEPAYRLQWAFTTLEQNNEDVRLSGLFEVENIVMEWRPAAKQAVQIIAKLIDNPSDQLSVLAAQLLPKLGVVSKNSLPILQAHIESNDNEVRTLAKTTLEQIESDKFRKSFLEGVVWFHSRKLDKSIPELIIILEERLKPPFKNDRLHVEALRTLSLLGSDAIVALPIVRKVLDHEDVWARINAARTLWHLEKNADEVMPTLLEALREGIGWTVIFECLAEMRQAGKPAIPMIHQLITSEKRFLRDLIFAFGVIEDELFCEFGEKLILWLERN